MFPQIFPSFIKWIPLSKRYRYPKTKNSKELFNQIKENADKLLNKVKKDIKKSIKRYSEKNQSNGNCRDENLYRSNTNLSGKPH